MKDEIEEGSKTPNLLIVGRGFSSRLQVAAGPGSVAGGEALAPDFPC